MTKLLEDKVAIITGAGGGLGRGCAEVFAKEGAKIILAGTTMRNLEETREIILQSDAEAHCIVTDVAETGDVKKMVEFTINQFGRLDCAVNNAGIDGDLTPTADYSEETFDRVIAVNLKGVWNCMRFQIPRMLEIGGGSIVNVSSAISEVGQYNMVAYCASKAGVNGMTKAASLDYGNQNIRINALLPGIVATPMMVTMMEEKPYLREPLLASEPIGRFGTPEEIGEAAAWLCSDRSSFASGSMISIDGGYLAK